jgi:hypothetical protein
MSLPPARPRGKSFRTKAEAERFAAKMATAQAEGTYVDPSAGNITLQRWWDSYLESRGRVLRPATRSTPTREP